MRRFAKAGLELFPLLQEVPVEVPLNVAGGIRESMLFVEGEPAVVERADDGATAFGAEVEGEIMRGIGHGAYGSKVGRACHMGTRKDVLHRPRARRLPASTSPNSITRT